MKIQKDKSREYKGKSFYKYKVNIPEGALKRAQMKAGANVEVTSEVGEILLKSGSKKQHEFDGVREKLYREAMSHYPGARKEDWEVMKKRLEPKEGERILEVGAGGGFFSPLIAKLIGKNGRLIVADPSLDQLENIKKKKIKNIDVIQFVQFGSENVDLEKNKVNAVWSFGAFHHSVQKQKSFDNISRILKKGGRVVISDVFSGSKLAKHFDDKVAKYCSTGHEVSFLSREYAESLCYKSGLDEPKFFAENIRWWFDNRDDIGDFIYKLHAMTGTTKKDCLKGCEEILGVEKKGNKYYLNWPMTTMVTYKK